jgi:hypothetical protein
MLRLALLAACAAALALPAAASAAPRFPIYLHQQTLAGSGEYTLAYDATARACGGEATRPVRVERTDSIRWSLGRPGFGDWLGVPVRPFKKRLRSLYEVFDRILVRRATAEARIAASWNDVSCDGVSRGRITVTCRISGGDRARSIFYQQGRRGGRYVWRYMPLDNLGLLDISDGRGCSASHSNPSPPRGWDEDAVFDAVMFAELPAFVRDGGGEREPGGNRTEGLSELGVELGATVRVGARQLRRRALALKVGGRLPARAADCRAEVADAISATVGSCRQDFRWSGRLALRKRCGPGTGKPAFLSISAPPYPGGPAGMPGFSC